MNIRKTIDYVNIQWTKNSISQNRGKNRLSVNDEKVVGLLSYRPIKFHHLS